MGLKAVSGGGAGSLPTSLQLGPLASPKTYNIRDYGALQDGTTDDSAALTAAIAASRLGPNGVVYIPDSTAGTRLVATTANVMTGGDVIIMGDVGGSKVIAPRSVPNSVSGSAMNVDFSQDMTGPYTISTLVTCGGYESASSTVNSLTLNSGNQAVYNNASYRLDRNTATYVTTAATRLSNIVTLTLNQNHDLVAGQVCTITNLTTDYNAAGVTIGVPAANQITYTAAGADGTAADQIGNVSPALGVLFNVIVDGTTLSANFDFTAYNFLNTGGMKIKGDGVTTVSVDGGAASAGNTVTLAADQAAFVKFSGGVINITTGIAPVINTADVVTRVEMTTAAEALNFAFGDVMHLDTNLEMDCSVSGARGYETNGATVYGQFLGYVFLTEKLKVDLSSAGTKKARKYAKYKCCIQDILFIPEGTPETGADPSGSKSCIAIIGAIRPQIIRPRVQDIWNFGWTFRSCMYGDIDNPICHYARNSAELGAEQYPINYDGFNKYMVIKNYHTEGSRHPFTTTITTLSAYSSTLFNVMRNGQMMNCSFVGAQINNVMGNGFDTHKVGTDFEVDGWVFNGASHWRYGTIIPKCIQHRAASGIYRNCVFRDYVDCISIQMDSDGEVRKVQNDIIFQDCIFLGSKGLVNTTFNTQRTIQLTGTTANTQIQRITFRNCKFSGNTTRFADSTGNYQLVFDNCDIGVNVVNSGFLIELDGDITGGSARNRITVMNCRIDTSGYGASVTGLIRCNGTMDVFLGPNEIRGTNYSAIIAASSNTDIQVYRWGKQTQLDQRREVVTGTVSGNTELDPRVVPNTTAVGNVGGGTDDLISYTLPARSLQDLNDHVIIEAWGTCANNVNAKTLKLMFGATAILTAVLTISQAGVWAIRAMVYNTGANTQDTSARFTLSGTAAQVQNEVGTAAITTTATIVIKCTGAATADNDIVQEGMRVELVRG